MRLPLSLMLCFMAFGCGGGGDDGCPEGTRRFGDPPDKGYETTCKKEVSDQWIWHGPHVLWHKNGEKKRESAFVDGQEHGLRTEWSAKGKKAAETPFEAGKINGVATEWFADGTTKRRETTYVAGTRHGALKEWYENGKHKTVGRFQEGALAEVKRWHENGLRVGVLEWVALPGGTFKMGAAGERGNTPRRVKVKPFSISKTEVTVEQYLPCVKAGACTEPKTGGVCNYKRSSRNAHPVNCVDWSQAAAFAAWAKVRLPSEAEWEYAARSGGKAQPFPWGDAKPTCERVIVGEDGDGCGKNSTWAACSKPKGNTAQGVCDMGGNVWEWVNDGDAKRKAMRGGSWNSGGKQVRVTNRRFVTKKMRGAIVGFRVAR